VGKRGEMANRGSTWAVPIKGKLGKDNGGAVEIAPGCMFTSNPDENAKYR
jgi:hypothetical protein